MMRTATFLWIGNNDQQRYSKQSNDLRRQPQLSKDLRKVTVDHCGVTSNVLSDDQHHAQQSA